MSRIAMLLLLACCTAASAQTAVRVKVFPGSQNLPLIAGLSQGYFERQGLKVEVLFTQSSQEQRDGLASGDFQIAHSAVDNAVAMVERAKKDVIIVSGGDSSMNEIFVQPEVKSVADLKGRTIIVDAPNTAYALLLYKALKNAGLNKGDYAVNAVGGTTQRMDAMQKDKAHAAAAVINVPFSFRLQALGMTDLGSATKSIGAYQAGSVVVMRDWAKANSDALVRYIAAIIEGRRWLLDPANKAEAVKLAVDRVKLTPDIAARAYDYVIDPKEGFNKDAQFDVEGFNNVLKLRAEIEGQWGGKPPAADKYVDLSYYKKAIASL